MEGQFYYIRSALDSYSDGNMAGMGTRIASITPNMMLAYEANRDLIGNKLEIRQDFGDAYLQQGRSMLKIYHTEGKLTVVARCYWIQNVLDADHGGRTGPYAHGFLYSDRDREALWRNVNGIFQVDVFEHYDSAAERIRRSGALPIQKERTLLHGGPKADMSAFLRAGFDRETFICYMGCLMDALAEQRDNVLVRLPDAVRQQWMNGGEDLAESVMHATLCLLPLFIRRRFSGLTHLDTRIDERWLVDTRLFFIDTPSEERFRELAVGNRRCIDLNTGICMNIPGDISKGFAAFLWDNLDNEERRDLFEKKLTQLLGVGSGGMSSRSMGDALDLLALQEENFQDIGAYQKLIFRVIPTLIKADESMFQRIYGAMNEQQVLLEDDLMKRTMYLLLQVGARASYLPHVLDLYWSNFLRTDSKLSKDILLNIIKQLNLSSEQLNGMVRRTAPALRHTVPPLSVVETLSKLYLEQKVGEEGERLAVDWAKQMQLYQARHIQAILNICKRAMIWSDCREETAKMGIQMLHQILLCKEGVDPSLRQTAETLLRNQLEQIQKRSMECQMELSQLVLLRWEQDHCRSYFDDLLLLFFNGPEGVVQTCQEILESMVLFEGGGVYFKDFILKYSAQLNRECHKDRLEAGHKLLWLPLDRKMPYLEETEFCALVLNMASECWKPWILKWAIQYPNKRDLYQTLGNKGEELYLYLFTDESGKLVGEQNCINVAADMDQYYGGSAASTWLVRVMEKASGGTVFDRLKCRYYQARRSELKDYDAAALIRLLPKEKQGWSQSDCVVKVQKKSFTSILAEKVQRASLETVKELGAAACTQISNIVPKESRCMELPSWQMIRGKIIVEDLKKKERNELIASIIEISEWSKNGVNQEVRRYIYHGARDILECRLRDEGARLDLETASILLSMEDGTGGKSGSRLEEMIRIFSILVAYETYPEIKSWMMKNEHGRNTINDLQQNISQLANEMILHNKKDEFQDEKLVQMMQAYAKKDSYNRHRKELYWALKKQGCHVEALFRETDVPKRKYRPLIPAVGAAVWMILSALLFLLAHQLERINGVAAIIVMVVLLLAEGVLCAILVLKLLLTVEGKRVYVQKHTPRYANRQEPKHTVQNEEEFEELSAMDIGSEAEEDEWP